MTRYVIQRLVLFIPTVLLVLTAVFGLIRMIPGDTVTLMVQDNAYAPSADALREKLGLNEPLPVQYLRWMGDLLRGDLGESLHTKRTAIEELKARAPVSFELGLLSILTSMSIALPIGVISATRAGTWLDLSSRSFAILMLAVPSFWLATIVIVVPSVLWNSAIVPKYVGFLDSPVQNLRVMIIPALIAGAASSAGVMRMTRTMVLEVQRQDYVRTARAKGLPALTVTLRHILRNALIPVITIIGLQIPAIISGSVIMEQVFGLPGMGQFLLDTISQRDYTMVQAMTMVFAFAVLFVNLGVDLMYPLLDPRIKYE